MVPEDVLRLEEHIRNNTKRRVTDHNKGGKPRDNDGANNSILSLVDQSNNFINPNPLYGTARIPATQDLYSIGDDASLAS